MAMHLRRFRPAAWIIAAIMIPLLGGCKDDSPADPDGGTPADPMPDFTLQDVNPNSPTFDQGVSPRDHLQEVSAWYFGHST